MKSYIVVLLAAVIAVQARSAQRDLLVPGHEADYGEAPWLVHLRMAHSQGGHLVTCAGSLIDPSWVLTTASCLENVRFIWVRYGTVDVISPKFVSETTNFFIHDNYNSLFNWNNVGLISLNRVIAHTFNYHPINIAPVSFAMIGADSSYCAFGAEGDGPGETLRCYNVEATQLLTGVIVTDGPGTTEFDLGTPLVHDNEQIGILIDNNEFLHPGAYSAWIQSITGNNK